MTNYSTGTAILVRKNFLGTFTPINISDDGRLVAADIDHLGSHLCVLSVYARNVPKDCWFNHQATQASRLDCVFVPSKLLENTFAEFFPYSDHKFVHCFLAIETNASNHGKSYWKLNNSILSDKYFREKVVEVLNDSRTLRPAFASTGEWWDDVKN